MKILLGLGCGGFLFLFLIGQTESDPGKYPWLQMQIKFGCAKLKGQNSLGAEPAVMHTSHDLQWRNDAVQEINWSLKYYCMRFTLKALFDFMISLQ